jgi:polysaccharide deacetylase family protein (PEP-CTERM system associated)
MTVDVEDYYHVTAFDRVVSRDVWDSYPSRVRRNTERLLALFEDVGVRATFFVLGWVAEKFPDLVREISACGHELASHSHWHRLVYDLTPEEFRSDLRRSRDAIEAAAGVRVTTFRAASYSITRRSLWALDILVDEGFVCDSSIFPVLHDRYGIYGAPRHPHEIVRPGGSIWEAPPATVRWAGVNAPVAGGGYFRQFPYGVTRWGFRRLNQAERRPGVFILHPWEIDPQQPTIGGISRATRLRHYRNLERTEERLQRLLRDFAFGPLSRVLADARALVA